MEEKPRRPAYRDEGRPRYREYDDAADRRPPPRREYGDRRSSGGYNGPRGADSTRPCKVLGVFGLSIQTTERDLYNIFSTYGRVRDIQMVYDRLTGIILWDYEGITVNPSSMTGARQLCS